MNPFHDAYPQQVDLSPLEGRLIGVAGKARRGKGTATAAIKAALPRVAEIASAEPIKAYCALVYNLTPQQLEETKDVPDPRYRETPRTLYQALGAVMRKYDGDVWINLSLRRAAYMLGTPQLERPQGGFAASWSMSRTDYVVISDIRYLNEAHAIRQAGGFLLLIDGPERAESGQALSASAATHESERDMDLPEFRRLCDVRLTNDQRDTKAEFQRLVVREIERAREDGALWK